MTREWRVARILPFALVALPVLAGIVVMKQRGAAHALESLASAASGEQDEENLCGPYALFVVMNRQGTPCSLMEIQKTVRVTDQGVLFGDLGRCAQRKGFRARLCRLTWPELKNVGCPAVLWVDGNHYVAADPRETHPAGEDAIRIYEQGRPAAWYSRTKLEARWTGESLVARREQPRNGGEEPRVQWETCLYDCGFVDPYEKHHFRYSFQNTGKRPLELAIARIGCGCAQAAVDPNIVLPGYQGVVTITLDMAQKRGYFATFVLLRTNDPLLPECAISASGGVYQPILASVDTLYLGEVHRGSSLVRSFYVQDRGDRTLQLISLREALERPTAAEGLIQCRVKNTLIEAHNFPRNAVSRYPVMVGDYLVELEVTVGARAPLGPLTGHVLVETNQPGKLREGRVGFKGTIVGDVIAEPSAILLSSSGPAQQVSLKSTSGSPVVVAEPPKTSGAIDVKMERITAPDGKLTYQVSLAGNCRPGTYQGCVIFETTDGTTVSVPVVVHANNPEQATGN